ncbi:MAG: hypothetical protein JST83_09465 [Bacteroidetes bacterium]|nr:hypothetical protein [Bacteroidota bacterium]
MSNHHPDAANKALAFGLPMFALTAVAGVLLFWLALSATEQQPAAQQTL